ncbi:MAG TPA: hypothetical protein VL359_05510, partial [bacterium]|nr:hypothetical protein [bacterium]
MKKMAVDSLLALSLVCLLTTFVEAVYTFGLLGTDIPPQIICVLFLLSPVLLIAFPRFTKNRAFAVVTGCAALACWAISMPLATLGRMLMSGAGCGLFLLFLPARIKQSEQEPGQTGASAALGILLLVALRATRSGNLLLSDGLGLGLGITFAAAGIVLLLAEALGATVPVSEPSPAGDPTGAAVHGAAPSFGGGRVVGLCLGLFALLLTVYGCFSSPTVLSRWAEASYTAVTAVQVGSLVLAVGACAVPWIRKRMGGGLVAAWNVLFLLSLTLTLLLRQPRFAGGGYPVAAPDPGLPGG